MYCDLELEATWDYKDKYLGVGCLGLKTTRRIEKEEKNQSKDVRIEMLLMSKSNYSGHVKINLLKYMMKYDFSNTDTLGDLLGKHVWPNVKVLIKNWDVWFESPSSFCN